MTDSQVSLAEIERLVAGEYHDPHSILGAHPGPEGIVIRALRPLATSVALVLDDGRRVPMTHLAQGVFTVTLPDEKVPDYRIATSYAPDGGDEQVTDDPYRFLPMIGEFDLYLIGEGLARGAVEGARRARPRGRPGDRDVVRRVGAERPRGARHRRLQLLGRPRVPDALAGRNGRVGAVRAQRDRGHPVQVLRLRPGRRVAGQGRPAGQPGRAGRPPPRRWCSPRGTPGATRSGRPPAPGGRRYASR